MEEYLPILVFSQISPDMKKETIKAQTVIARSNIQRRIGEGKNLAEILWENRNTGEVWRYFFTEKNTNLSAVSERDGRAGTDI
jgi:Stage II sporulation protein.